MPWFKSLTLMNMLHHCFSSWFESLAVHCSCFSFLQMLLVSSFLERFSTLTALARDTSVWPLVRPGCLSARVRNRRLPSGPGPQIRGLRPSSFSAVIRGFAGLLSLSLSPTLSLSLSQKHTYKHRHSQTHHNYLHTATRLF